MSFQKGDVVAVYNQTMSGRPLFEGRAEIIKPTGVKDQYLVRFMGVGSDGLYNRFVYPGECQADPEAYFAKVLADWEARAEGAIYCEAAWPGVNA